jgi:hypothetical protein
VFAIWTAMMPGDSRSSWPSDVFADSRVTNLWDARDVTGHWFGIHRVGGLGGPSTPFVWDAYFGYGAAARWREAPTEPLVVGSSIITHTSGLQNGFVPVLHP